MKRSELLWSAVGILAALAAAAGGVWLYAVDPNVVTFHVNILLLAPLLMLVLKGLSRVLPYRLQWALAIVLAPLGGAAYLQWPNEQWWADGVLLAAPLVALAIDRDERVRERDGDPPSFSSVADGPWGPP